MSTLCSSLPKPQSEENACETSAQHLQLRDSMHLISRPTALVASPKNIGLVLAAIPTAMILAFRFVDPAKLVGCSVVRLDNVEVTSFLPSSNRGIYAIGLNRKPFSGFATALAKSHLSPRLNAYVIAEHRIVVALEPLG